MLAHRCLQKPMVCHFIPCLILQARLEPTRVEALSGLKAKGRFLALSGKHKTRVVFTNNDKQSALLRCRINYDRQKLDGTGPRSEKFIKILNVFRP